MLCVSLYGQFREVIEHVGFAGGVKKDVPCDPYALPQEAPQLEPCFADYPLSVTLTFSNLSWFKALLTRLANLLTQTGVPLREVDPLSPHQLSIFKQGPMVIGTKSLLPTPVVQPVISLENLSPPPPILPPPWKD